VPPGLTKLMALVSSEGLEASSTVPEPAGSCAPLRPYTLLPVKLGAVPAALFRKCPPGSSLDDGIGGHGEAGAVAGGDALLTIRDNRRVLCVRPLLYDIVANVRIPTVRQIIL